MKNRGLSISHIATRTGLAASAIRYYEDQGLIAPGRGPGGQRQFEKADIRRLSFIMIAQSLGFSIAEIRDQLSSLPEGRTPTAADWRRLSATYRADLDHRIDQLTRLRDDLDGCIGCGCLSLDRCGLYNPGDRAARQGPGPRYMLGDAPLTEEKP
ncbi:redox-sensitive transcriptional activator SoxR [Pseudooceanicola nitratireducens]|uniref:redox-sensitive transcriptional activator SoxR n=1 Tax=Pseudooceanicola nitratireducens TaxID=517719 RepID=UPI001C97F225|nr:redox-sensitive transcriptional activator SoxR [Pseudooceanicola nitratireducens]MBY6157904.1 redox-sensitive transcriptional activator SoxR [Pseudooceanicola nitratireducens]